MKNKTFKKSISVFLSVLMILSCWVWTPLEHNHVSAATTEVKVTTSFTLSPNGNRGATDWTRLALTGESSAGGTSVVLFRFTNDDLKQFAELDTVNLQFYAYSCNNRLSHNNVGVTVMADVYYITQNGSLVSAQGTNKNANVTDTGNAALGTNYTETYMQNHAKSYFGLSDSTLVGSFEQPAINGQDNESLRTGDVNCSYPVTDIVKEKADAGEDISFIVMLRQGYSCSGTRGWSDVYINSDSIALSGYNAVDELKNRIEAYEEYFSNGIFYTNLQNNYKAYNDAKRYYDAVTYGGVQFDAAIAQNYISAIDTAIANTGFNETYINYLNASISSRDGSSVSAEYRKNVIWYPWDFSWDITTNNARPEIQNTFFYFTMPNTIVGITNDSETTFPLHSFFWTTTDSRYVRYVIAGSGTASSGVVGSSDFATMAPWKISDNNNIHSTSGLNPGADGFGGWVFEKNYRTDVTLDNHEDNSSNFGYSQDLVYQISSYAQINKNSIGVNSTTTYKKVDQGFTFATANSGNNGTTNYGNHYASNYSNYGGALHVVYMDTYKNNYENWKTLIPALSYKNYNGYIYNDAVNVTTNLDYASEIPLNLNLTEANRVGDITSTVTTWAQNINKGANDLKNAKAAGTTKVTTKYVDLTNAIKNSEAAYADGSAKYTYASWNNFVAAYNAAKAHMASLDPSGSNVQYSSDATAIGNLASALDNARNALRVRTYDVTYENMFSFSNWVNSASGVIGTPAKGTMTYDVNAGTITINNNGANTQSEPHDHYTSYGFGNGHYNMTLVPGETYTFEYTASGGTADQVHIFFYDNDGNAVANPANRGSAFANAYGTGRSTSTITFTAPENATKAAFRFGTTVLGESVTFSDLFMYSHTRGDYADIAGWTDRPNRKVYPYGTALGTSLEVPVRPGHTFNGWWVDSINPNGQKDAGEQVTDGNGTVVADLQGFGITQDWVLYSEWTVNKYTVTWKNGDTVLETDTDVPYGTTPEYNGATPTKASDDDYEYTFKGWSPAIATVTGDVTYVAEFDAIAKTKYYTVTFKDWDGTVLSTQTVEEGTAATAPANPSRNYDDNNHYAFASWDKSFSNITADTEVTATYTTTAHSYNYVQNADGANHTGTCSCGKTVTGVCSGGSSTCETKAVCATCGEEYGDLAAHTEVIIPAKEATCAETGLTEGKKCSVCDTIIVAQTVVPKKAHTEEIIPAVESTCTKTGLTEGKKCSVCGEILVAQQTTDMAAHTMGDWITDSEPTCSAEGTKHRDCEVCGYSEPGTIPATGVHVFTVDPQPKAGSQTFHDYKCATCDLRGAYVNGVPTIGMAEECYKTSTIEKIDGNNSYHKETCVCGNTRDNVAHTLIDVEGTYVAPTCTAKGSQGKECTECGYTFTKELPEDANAHAYGEWIDEAPATCIATGTKGHYTCSLCNKNFNENKVEIDDLTIGIDADAHTKLNKTDANPATCTDEGNIEYWTCEGCGKIYSDANAETEITAEETVIGKIAHNWISATDSTDGFTHKTPADCDSKAVYYMNCSACGQSAETIDPSKTFEYGDFRAHDWSDWAASGEVTLENKDTATHSRYCKYDDCDVTETYTHNWSYEETLEPSYTQDGEGTYTCTVCGATVKETIPANEDEINPTVSIKWGTTVWNSILSTITFGRYVNYDIELEINAEDDETGIAKVEYLVSNTEIDDVTAVTEGWTSYDANNKLTIAKENEANYVVYARVTDNAGNVSYASTDGFVLDITKPVISLDGTGNKETLTYCDDVTVTVTDDLDVTVTLNDAAAESSITVSEAGDYTVVATDKAGNESTVTFTVNANHTWNAGVVTKDPTCTEEGVKTFTCEVCGDTKTEKVEALGHEYGEWISEIPASCIATGTKGHYHCAVCGVNFDADKNVLADLTLGIDADAHTKLNKTDANPATCTDEGNIEYWTCEGCGKIYTEEAATNEIELADTVIPATDHNWDEGAYLTEEDKPTCTEKGTLTYTCQNDNSHTKTEEVEALGHEYGEWIAEIPASCIATGTKGHYHCAVCGVNFDADKNVLADLTIGIDADAHTKLNKTDANPATCTTAGNIEYWTCEGCGKIYTEESATNEIELADTVIPATDHDWDEGAYLTEEDKPTCTEKGTLTYTCQNDNSHTKTEEVEALGHEYGAWIAEIPATCVATGTKGHYHCAVCGVNFDADKNVLADLTIGIDADAHTKLNKTDANPATCTTAGNIEYWTCEGCGKIYTEESATNEIELADTVIPATDHDWDEGAYLTEEDKPTCTEKGTLTYTCQNDNSHTKTEEVEALGHEYGAWIAEIPATCVATGTKGHYHCAVCGVNFDADKNVLADLTIGIDADAHTKLNKTDANPATCTDEGNIEYWTCEGCGKIYTEEAATNEIELADTVIPATDHDWDEGAYLTEEDKPTCTEKGTLTYTCQNANCPTKTYTEEVEALGHEYGEWIAEIPASCIATGTKGHYHCAVCGVNFDADKNVLADLTIGIDADAHTGTATVIKNQKAATCTAEGYTGDIHWSCCDALETKGTATPKLAHTPDAAVEEKRVEPTCDKAGSYESVVYCSVCGTEISRTTVEIPANGENHKWNLASTKEATCIATGLEVYVCEYCGEEKENVLPIDSDNHKNIVEGVYEEPTCTTPGYTGATVCKDCGKLVGAGTITPAYGHKFSPWTIITMPSDDGKTPGYAERYCLRCGGERESRNDFYYDDLHYVVYHNDNGVRLTAPRYYIEGDYTIRPEKNPTKAQDDKYTYEFIGWDHTEGELNSVHKQMAVIAQYKAIEKSYKVIFRDASGKVIPVEGIAGKDILFSEITKAYNGATPTKAATSDYRYEFMGWNISCDYETGEATVTPEFRQIPIEKEDEDSDGIFGWLIRWIKSLLAKIGIVF